MRSKRNAKVKTKQEQVYELIVECRRLNEVFEKTCKGFPYFVVEANLAPHYRQAVYLDRVIYLLKQEE